MNARDRDVLHAATVALMRCDGDAATQAEMVETLWRLEKTACMYKVYHRQRSQGKTWAALADEIERMTGT